jgi:glycosyltransferase involved in cell wall biosynthesis
MKILLVTPMPPDRTAPGAIPALLHAQLLGLAARHDVAVLTIAGPDERELAAVDRLARDGFEVHAARRLAAVGEPCGPQRRRLAATWARTGWPYRTVAFWAPGVQTTIDRLAAERRFDVITVEDSAMGVYRIPPSAASAYTEHEVRGPALGAGPPEGLRGLPVWLGKQVNWRRWAAYQPAVWRSFHVVQAFTDRDAATIRDQLPQSGPPVLVNPFGIDLPPQVEADEDPDLAVFVGNYTHQPNVDAALFLGHEILPRLRERHPTVQLALAGIYPPASVRELEGAGVRVLGRVDDVDALTRRAAIVFAPVRTGGGMRMKILHAMALGTAVVTTPLGIEGLASGGRVPPVRVGDDAGALAAAAAQLLRDPAARRQLGADARAFVQRHHSPEAYAARLTETYELAIDRRRSIPRSPELTSST